MHLFPSAGVSLQKGRVDQNNCRQQICLKNKRSLKKKRGRGGSPALTVMRNYALSVLRNEAIISTVLHTTNVYIEQTLK